MDRRPGELDEVNLLVTHLPVRDAWRLAVQDLRAGLRGRVRLIARSFNIMLFSVDYDDPYYAVADLRGSLPGDTPILRVIPVHKVVVPPDVELVKRAVGSLLDSRPPGSFAIRLEGRLTAGGRDLGRDEAVRIIAEASERPVNLRRPDILVLIKHLRLKRLRAAAIYVGPPDGVLSTAKEA